ncbi:hypothetical protein LguiA_021313 [Lonicera macranthoides]
MADGKNNTKLSVPTLFSKLSSCLGHNTKHIRSPSRRSSSPPRRSSSPFSTSIIHLPTSPFSLQVRSLSLSNTRTKTQQVHTYYIYGLISHQSPRRSHRDANIHA